MSKPANAVRLHVEPISKRNADRFIDAIHRHHGPTPPGLNLFTIAAVMDDGTVCGVATAAIPNAANRLADGARTMEVVRVATDGTPNACSVLYGACAKAARSLGYSRIITYILPEETGTSLKGSGWVEDDGSFGNLSWANRPGRTGSNFGPKGRWSLTFTDLDRPAQILPTELDADDHQPSLFNEAVEAS